jgi:hypothetical protein
MKPRLKMGMVGGGGDATIGAIHKIAAQLDGKSELVAGAFSSHFDRSRRSGEAFGLNASRIYSDYRSMATHEAELPAGNELTLSPSSHQTICTSRWQRRFWRMGSTLCARSR